MNGAGRIVIGHGTGDTGSQPGLVGSRARQSRSPAPLCFAQKQVVGIVVDSSALREGPPLDVNQGQGEESRGEEKRGEEKGGEKKDIGKDGTRWMECSRWHLHQLAILKKVGWQDDST